MAGKYAKVLDKLEKFTMEDQTYQDKVNAEKLHIVTTWRAHTGMPPGASLLVAEYIQERKEKDQIEADLYRQNLRIEALSQLIIDQYEAEGISTLKLADNSSVRTQPEPYTAVKDREVFRKWCIEAGYANQMALPWQTTNAIAKDRLLKGLPEPEGCQVFVKTKLVMTAGDS